MRALVVMKVAVAMISIVDRIETGNQKRGQALEVSTHLSRLMLGTLSTLLGIAW